MEVPSSSGGLSGLALLSPRLSCLRSLSPRDTIGLLRQGLNPEDLSRSPERSRADGSRAGSVRAASRAGSVHSQHSSRLRFWSPEEEQRIVQKGHEERIRAWARERREQLREAQKLQAEQELLLRQQRRRNEREAQKRLLEKDRFEEWRRKLEKRDISRAKLWEKSLKLGDSRSPSPSGSRSPQRSPRPSAASAAAASPSQRSERSPRGAASVASLSPRRSQALSPRLSGSSSLSALLSPRERIRSWDLNIASYSREEVRQLESERLNAVAEKELRVLEAREFKTEQRLSLDARRDQILGPRTNELEAIRQAREEKRQQEMQKRARDRERRMEQRQMRRAGEIGTKEYEERTKELRLHQQRERKVYLKQQQEQQAEEKKLLEAGRKELLIQEARLRHERDREQRQKQQLLEQAAKEREAEALRDAREAWKEELKQRRVRDLELKRAKVLAVKADQDERRKKREEEKAYVYTPVPKLSDKVKAAAEALAREAQLPLLSEVVAAQAMPAG